MQGVTSMLLELDEETRGLLTRILTTYVADLRMEIAATDSPTFKVGLRHEEDVLKALLEELRGRPA
jgi:hypothetical protein